MIGLREEIKGHGVLQGVTAFDESRRVTREGGWVAGDVGDDLRVDLQNRVEGEFVDASAGWVNDHVNVLSQLRGERGQNFFGSAFVEFDIVEFVEVDGEIFIGGFRGFDTDDFVVFGCEEFTEQADAAINI